jgi:DNA-binding NtrC family response regulator
VLLPEVEAEVDASGSFPTSLARGRETILLVEDEESVRTFARTALQEQGYRVLEAANGDEALHLIDARRGAIDLLLTDGVMPGLPVGELLGRVRASLPLSKVLLMSGYAGEVILESRLGGLALPFLPKPFTSSALVDRVRGVLDGRG